MDYDVSDPSTPLGGRKARLEALSGYKFFYGIDEYLAYLEAGARRWDEIGEHRQAEWVRAMIDRIKRGG